MAAGSENTPAGTSRTGHSKRTVRSFPSLGLAAELSSMSSSISNDHAIFQDPGLPPAQGLYAPHREHDACGVGFIANMHNHKSHEIVAQGLKILLNLDHRGAVGADPK